MATAFNQFRKAQAGMESTKGTGVAATRVLQGDFVATEEINRYYSQFPQGFRANPGGTGVPVMRGFTGAYSSELTFEEIIWFLSTGLVGGIAPVLTGSDINTWTYDPVLTAAPTLDSATFEYTESDGSTNHIAREVNYTLCSGFKVDWAFNQEAKFSADVFGRRPVAAAPTAALAVYPSREIAVSNRARLFMDSTWAGLGTTQVDGTIRSASLEVMTGNEPDSTLEGRIDLDMPQHRYGLVAAKINLVLQLNATGAAKISGWRDGDATFVRLSQLGSLIEASTYKEIKFDSACRYIGSDPGRQTDGQYRNVSISLETFLDPTSSKTFKVQVINKLTTVA